MRHVDRLRLVAVDRRELLGAGVVVDVDADAGALGAAAGDVAPNPGKGGDAGSVSILLQVFRIPATAPVTSESKARMRRGHKWIDHANA